MAEENNDVVRLRKLQEFSNSMMCPQVEAVLRISFLRISILPANPVSNRWPKAHHVYRYSRRKKRDDFYTAERDTYGSFDYARVHFAKGCEPRLRQYLLKRVPSESSNECPFEFDRINFRVRPGIGQDPSEVRDETGSNQVMIPWRDHNVGRRDTKNFSATPERVNSARLLLAVVTSADNVPQVE